MTLDAAALRPGLHVPALSGRATAAAALGAILLLALALRLAFALDPTTILRPDAIYQTLEPAHRLVYGWGVVAWEWRDGIRSWLLPAVLAAIMAASRAVFAGPDAYMTSIPVVLSLGSLAIVVAAFALGWRTGRMQGAILTALAAATWPDLVFYAARTLTEVQSAPFLAVAAVLATLMQRRVPQGAAPQALAPVIAIGACLAIAFCLRFQLAPAIAVIGLWAATRCTRRTLPILIMSFVVPVLLQGLSDAVILGSPFQSIWKNAAINILEDRAASFGVLPFDYFLTNLVEVWGVATLPVGVLFALGARRAPILVAAAAAIVLSHSLIAHKEAAFIYAAIPLVVIVAGLGLSEAARLLPFIGVRLPAPLATAGLTALWLAASAFSAPAILRTQTTEDTPGLFATSALLRQEVGLCGVALYGHDFVWYATGGYASLNRPVPMSIIEPSARPITEANALVYEPGQTALPAGWTKGACTGAYCIARIEQTCKPNPDTLINTVLARTGQ